MAKTAPVSGSSVPGRQVDAAVQANDRTAVRRVAIELTRLDREQVEPLHLVRLVRLRVRQGGGVQARQRSQDRGPFAPAAVFVHASCRPQSEPEAR